LFNLLLVVLQTHLQRAEVVLPELQGLYLLPELLVVLVTLQEVEQAEVAEVQPLRPLLLVKLVVLVDHTEVAEVAEVLVRIQDLEALEDKEALVRSIFLLINMKKCCKPRPRPAIRPRPKS
jgi:hypothetical protein